jgi:hypothetical protein
MTVLWTFENQEKLQRFAEVLASNDIAYETGSEKLPNSLVTLSVDEADYVKAKKLLMKHRKRRTSADFH